LNETLRMERDSIDIETNHKCSEWCPTCEKYSTMKEANRLCEVRKARGRITNRQISTYKKLHKAIDIESLATVQDDGITTKYPK